MNTSPLPHPGRLRLRFSLLKKNPARMAAVCDALRAIGGIGAVEGSPVTGAMLIHYDGAAGNNPRFWDDVEAVLEYHHLHHDARRSRATRSALGRLAASLLTQALLQRLAGSSAGAMVVAALF